MTFFEKNNLTKKHMRHKIVMLLTALLLITNCNSNKSENTQKSQAFKLPSGKEIKVTGINKTVFQKGDAALVLNYETEIPIEDKNNLNKEVNEIWSVFQSDVEAANLNVGVIRATHYESSGIVRNGKGYGFAFVKGQDGQWHLNESNK